MEFLPEIGLDAVNTRYHYVRTAPEHSTAFKAKVAFAAIKGEQTLVELYQQFYVLGVAPLISIRRPCFPTFFSVLWHRFSDPVGLEIGMTRTVRQIGFSLSTGTERASTKMAS